MLTRPPLSRWFLLSMSTALLLGSILAAPIDPPVKPRIVILATGGTIAGTASDPATTVGYQVATLSVETLIQSVPSLAQVARVRGEQVFQIASENITPTHWLTLARRINTLLAQPDVDGVVITHGTDTLEETAFFLHLTVKSAKPVVLVGAMRPATALSADGPMNLFNAVVLAGSPEARGRGVLVSFDDRIEGAREVTKTHTEALGAFRSPEFGPLGIFEGGRPVFYRQSPRRHTQNSEFSLDGIEALPAVEIVLAYAGAPRSIVESITAGGTQGLIYAGVGNGSVPQTIRPALTEARQKGVVIVRASRVGSGRVARNGEVNDDELDFVVADNLNPQKARILLMLALTRTHSTSEIQRIFREY